MRWSTVDCVLILIEYYWGNQSDRAAMGVTHIHSDGEFRALLENNQPGGSSDNLFLVDYSAKW